MTRQLLTAILCCCLPAALLAAEPAEQPATVLQQTPLRAEPFSDAPTLIEIKAKQQVTIMQRTGGWYQVRHGERTGWLRMSRVRFGDGSPTQKPAAGLGQTLQFLSTGRSGASGVTVATGIRGLDAADVANAQPDHQALGQLDRYQVTPTQARTFADSAELKSQPLGYFKQQ